MQEKSVDVSKCPKCGGLLSKIYKGANKIFKCEKGCLLRLVFENEIRPVDCAKPIWLDQENKEYPATLLRP